MNKLMIVKLVIPVLSAMSLGLISASCSDDNGGEDPTPVSKGLYIVNEGTYNAGNASLSFYDPVSKTVENDVFAKANDFKLGDSGQSMTRHGDKGWVVVGNSKVIFAIDLTTFKECGRITGFTSPRYIHFVNDTKAYVTQMYDPNIAIVNPQTMEITGAIEVPDMDASTASTENMVQVGDYVYVSCWSYNKEILKIDTRNDEIVDRLEVGLQPSSMAVDKNGKLWTLCDGGGWEANPIGYEAPSLCRIDLQSFEVDRRIYLEKGSVVRKMVIDGDRDDLYWVNGGIWHMDIDEAEAPTAPFISVGNVSFYSLTVNPENGDIYASDPVDYTQSGTIYRYDEDGNQIDKFTAGIIPSAFCWIE